MPTLPTGPDHLLSLAEWDALPEDTSRHYEMVDGVVVVAPRPVPRHQRVAKRLTAAIDRALLPSWEALMDVEVVVDATTPSTVRAPDVLVVRPETIDDRARYEASDLLAVVEILSPGSRRTDRVAKLHDYAEAGIECYLLVDPGPPTTLTEFRLIKTVYERVAEHSGTTNLTLDGSAVVVDLAGMLGP